MYKIRSISRLLGALALVWSSLGYSAGLLTPKGSSESLDIVQHHVNVVIEDGYVVTSVDQIFSNPNSQDMEAIYSFPIPEAAAVGEFTYWIDGKAIIGEVIEKEKARQIYNEEKQAGREVALTEQDSYKTFDISIASVKAGQNQRIKLTYIQAAHVDTSIGRYVYPLEEGGTDEEKLSFWNYNEVVKENFSFNLSFRSSYPIDGLRLPKHPHAVIQKISEQEWSVSLGQNPAPAELEIGEASEEGTNTTTSAASEAFTLDQDIVVYWRLQQGLPAAVDLITYRPEGQKRGTFMLTVTPGDDLAKITEGRDWVFILDTSGSMSGKYQSLVEGVRGGLQKLNSNDRFRVILFNNSAQELTGGYVNVTPENITQYIQLLENNQPGGGTNLYQGLARGIDALDADRSSAVILVTDGVANVGQTEKRAFLKLLENQDVRLFTFVMGNSANRPLLNSMADVSNGFAISVSNSDDIVGKIFEATSKLTHEAMHDVEVKFKNLKVKDLTPAHIGSVYHGQQLVMFGHYWGDGLTELEIHGKISGKPVSYNTSFEFPQASQQHPELERLWAFAKIEDLQSQLDYFGADPDIEQGITGLATEYGLVTEYTSMIVMREAEFINRGIDRSNARRVELEHAARSQRQAAPVSSHRVDQSRPISNTPRASHGGGSGGGGALTPWMVLILLPLLWFRLSGPSRMKPKEV